MNVESVEGWDRRPSLRGRPIPLPGQHGGVIHSKKFYNPKEFSMGIVLLGQSSAGAVTHTEGAHAHLRENINILMGLLDTHDGEISVRRTVPDYPGAGTVTEEAMCEVLDVVPFGEYKGAQSRFAIVTFSMAKPFYRIIPIRSYTGFTTGNIVTNGNAPIDDMRIDFNGYNGVQRLMVDDTTDYIEIDEDTTSTPVIVEVGAKTARQGGVNVPVVRNRGWWMEWPAADAALGLTLTGSGDVDLTFYDKRF